MAITSLAAVKAKLQIPLSDTSEDAAIQPVADLAAQFVASVTGYDDAATQHVDIREECLAGDTRVITWRGTRPISEMAGTEQTLLTTGGRWVSAPIRSFGVRPLLRLTLSRARRTKVLRATAEHKWLVRTDRIGHTREVTTEALRRGDLLAYSYPESTAPTLDRAAVARGFTFGDGFAQTGRASSSVQFHGEKDEALLPYFEGYGRWRGAFPQPRMRPGVAVAVRTLRGLPDGWNSAIPSVDDDPSEIAGWLAGYFAADGSVSDTGEASLWSARREHLEAVRALATAVGIGTYGIGVYVRTGYGEGPTPLYYLSLMKSALWADFFVIEAHRERFASHPASRISPRSWTVVAVEATDEAEEVFCAVVPSTEAFALEDNILTHNCQIGRRYELDHRPIDDSVDGSGHLVHAVTAEGRTHAGVESRRWVTLVADVVDADKGRVTLLGVSNFFQAFPPIEPPNPIFKWQQPIWPVVRFTYTTVAQAGLYPADLADQANHFGAFMYKHQLTSGLVMASLGEVREMYHGSKGGISDIIPPDIRATFGRYAIKRTFWTA